MARSSKPHRMVEGLRPSVRRARCVRPAIALALLPLLTMACRIEVEPEEDTSLEPSVLAMLDRSAADWNRGDLEAFLADYQDAPATTIVGPRGVLSGPEEIRAHYAPAFEPGAERDSLRFEAVRVRSLSPLIGIVTARWVLHENGVTTSSGPFTLVMRRTGSGWKITHDHSSSDPAPAGD
ncbi:MAG: nuclear transport factor 2 family protein [Gemmatimonadota bacterium]